MRRTTAFLLGVGATAVAVHQLGDEPLTETKPFLRGRLAVADLRVRRMVEAQGRITESPNDQAPWGS